MKMPMPITLEMTMTAASSGPRRRSSEGGDDRVTRRGQGLLRQELSRNRVLAEPRPLRRTVLREEGDLRIDEQRVLEHLHARLRPGVAQLRLGDERLRLGAGREPGGTRGRQKRAAPFFLVGYTAEDRVHLEGHERFIGNVL